MYQRERDWVGTVARIAVLLMLLAPCVAWAASEGGHESGGLISLDKSLIIQFFNFIVLLLILQRLLYEPFIAKMKAPLLVLVAGDDQATTPEQAMEFKEKLEHAGVPFEQHVYKGAPHSFFDRSYEQWQDACDDAWRRMLNFVTEHS